MASTYSDLKIELIGTGEQSGIWGVTTNTNLGTALEEAIVGSADVTFSSADVTLTLTNTNASQVARHLRLKLVGTSGGARSLILGSGCQIDKPYLIDNTLADTITVKNTTGTGVDVLAGEKKMVYNDGTNVVEALTISGGINYEVKTSNYTAKNKEGILADTSGGAFTITLPATPAAGDQVVVADSSGNWGTNNLTIGRNGSTIESIAQDLVCDISGVSVQLIYNGTTWEVYSQIGANGGTVVTEAGAQTLTNKTIAFSNNTFTGALPVANGGTGATTLTADNVVLGDGTNAVKFVAPGSNGNVLTSNGTTWTSAAVAAASKAADVQTFDSSGTWTKPTGYGASSRVLIQVWGGGGGGSKGGASNHAATGGGGGGYNYRWINLSAMGATETITIGSGGAAITTSGNGNTGGNSSVGSLVTAYGGGGGQTQPGASKAGGGGGQLSGGQIGNAGGPQGGSGQQPAFGRTGTDAPEGSGGGGGSTSSTAGCQGFYKGGGGGGDNYSGCNPATTGGSGGASVWGGGGGGCMGTTTGGSGGTSSYGGNGGAGGSNAGDGTAGTQPAGGGGGARSSATTSGAGGDGRVTITVFDGA